ncbi:MAG: DUF1403 family protein [Pseudotabrizicola sp.]|uniref:DUF1403 family protein n=1 Tax=Pseudotabrizicola sp. TaxID=2939647 RepID=UPI0027285AA5|nr:DUF1403 family protein [Pseudotabrizicola sp.]MDO9638236.1 DUF1403 family protein [Pseudotabrizicola sp.]
MKPAIAHFDPGQRATPVMPGWVAVGRAEAIEDMAFLSGAALAHLQISTTCAQTPQALWRARLALASAEVCVRFGGRPEGASALRDTLHLTRPGDHPGPAGEVLGQWARAAERPVSVAGLRRALPKVPAEKIALLLDTAQGTPVARAAAVIEAVLTDSPRAETTALILGDAVLALALGWSHLLPLLATGLKPRDLRQTGAALRLLCHRAVITSARPAVQLAADLARRADRLRAVAPKLRAKGAGQAVEMFLTRDAVAPSALVPILSDRAARRLCDRLVALGAVRELTGRDTFRLYGL